jgi:putative nucleotidyltransferase with HDIG domain
MATSAADLVRDIRGLVTLPDVYLRIDRLLNDPNSSTSEIAGAIKQDASFTVRLLRVANSALYRFPSSVETVEKAVLIIGTGRVRDLALSMSVARSFAGLPNDLVSMENFWRHSLLCALAARRLAGEVRRCDPDALFTAGLLHDIGELILFHRMPEKSREALLMVLDGAGELAVHEAERKVIGFDHSAVGGELARGWSLPALLQECIGHHHDLANATRHPREAALVHLANSFAHMAEVNRPDPAEVDPIDPVAWQRTGLTPESIEPTVRAVQAEIGEIEGLFLDAK